MPNHTLEIHSLGPIKECTLTVNRFTVLTGPQSNGKSTIAKAVYFFRTVKQDILNIMMQGGPRAVVGDITYAAWEPALKQKMRDKFLQLFGTSWIMPDQMELKYTYTSQCQMRVFLRPDFLNDGKNLVDFEFSPSFQAYLRDLDSRSFTNISADEKSREEDRLADLLDDPYETAFIPAGRNLITLLTAQLNYIFTSLDAPQLRNIDYVTRRYTELILKLKPLFETGMIGMLADAASTSEQIARYKRSRNLIRLLLNTAEAVLHGTYRCVGGEERLYLDENQYVKINYASSGQQEIVWVFNLLFYYLLEGKKVLLILEEPESHLYPDSQELIAQALSLFHNSGNAVLSTTHSPYVLGTYNYMLLAGQVPSNRHDLLQQELAQPYWLHPAAVSAYHVHDGKMDNALSCEDGLTLIENALIDGASQSINRKAERFIELIDAGDDDDKHKQLHAPT